MKASEAFRIIAAVCCCVVMAGCTHVFKSSSIPSLQIGSPLQGVQPKTFVLKEFKDTRFTGDDPYLVSQWPGKKLKMDEPVATIVRTAIRKELERNGHHCLLDETKQSADFTIEGTVYKYWLQCEAGFYRVRCTANTGLKLTMVGIGSHQVAFTKNYEGSYFLSSMQFVATKDVLDQALLNMLKELTTDQQFVDAIQK